MDGTILGPIGGRYRLTYRVGVEGFSLVKHFGFDFNFTKRDIFHYQLLQIFSSSRCYRLN